MEIVPQFQAPEGSEIMGIGIIGVFENIRYEVIKPILEKHDLKKVDIKADEWYSLQLYFDLYKELQISQSGTENFVAIGKAVAQNVTNPDEIGSMENFVNVELNRTATVVIRNTPEGYGYNIEKLDNNHYQIVNNTGAPNDIIYGYIWESLRILAQGKNFSFKATKDYPSKEFGSTFEISW